MLYAALLAVAAAAFVPALAVAQQVTLEPSAAVGCLSPASAVDAGPEYPFVPFKRGFGGRVKVELEFTAADAPPIVKTLSKEGAEDSAEQFVDAVTAHVRQFRVPCMQPGQDAVRLVQEFVFAPTRSLVLGSHPVDLEDTRRAELLACVLHESGKKAPPYPDEALRAGVQGRVVARLRFDAPDSPPQAEVFARPAASGLRREIQRWVSGYRMPCHRGAALTASWVFVFIFQGGAYGFKPLTLTQLLPSVRDIGKQTLAFDTTTMNCPFELWLDYRRPFLPNLVAELASTPPAAPRTTAAVRPTAVPERRLLMKWLEGVEIDAPRETLDRIFGDDALITVPCMKIDLKPKE